jgi:hypothetical protein
MKKKPPLLSIIVINKFEKKLAPLEEGEEKTHCCQQHCVSLPINALKAK